MLWRLLALRLKRVSSPRWRGASSCLKALDGLSLTADQQVGVNASNTPTGALRQIAANAGADASVVVNKVLENGDGNFGYNAAVVEYVDLLGAGVVDPTGLSLCCSLLRRIGLLLTTEAMIAENLSAMSQA